MEIALYKAQASLVPADENAAEWLSKVKSGSYIVANVKRPRNPLFHRKFFALLRWAFDQWDPGEVSSRHGTPEKCWDQFREDLTILAGYYETAIRTNGDVRIRAKSISFSSMDEDEFEKLYQAVITVLMERVLIWTTEKEIREITDKLLSYT